MFFVASILMIPVKYLIAFIQILRCYLLVHIKLVPVKYFFVGQSNNLTGASQIRSMVTDALS